MVLWMLCAKSVDVPLRNELLACSHIGRNHQSALMNLTDVNVPTQRKVRGARGRPSGGRAGSG